MISENIYHLIPNHDNKKTHKTIGKVEKRGSKKRPKIASSNHLIKVYSNRNKCKGGYDNKNKQSNEQKKRQLVFGWKIEM